jgi:hypothetical protein
MKRRVSDTQNKELVTHNTLECSTVQSEAMSEASVINASINNEEQEEKGVQPEQGDEEGLVNESKDEEKPSRFLW